MVKDVNFKLLPEFFDQFLVCTLRQEREIRKLEIYLSAELQDERLEQRKLFKKINRLDSQLNEISRILQMGTFHDIQRMALEITYINLEQDLKTLLTGPQTVNFNISETIKTLYTKYAAYRL